MWKTQAELWVVQLLLIVNFERQKAFDEYVKEIKRGALKTLTTSNGDRVALWLGIRTITTKYCKLHGLKIVCIVTNSYCPRLLNL